TGQPSAGESSKLGEHRMRCGAECIRFLSQVFSGGLASRSGESAVPLSGNGFSRRTMTGYTSSRVPPALKTSALIFPGVTLAAFLEALPGGGFIELAERV